MRVPTANVIVGFNREAMDRLFTTGATYTDLIKELSKPGPGFDDTLLFDSVANPNFISFEHTLGMGNGMHMKLTLIDPKGEFEKRFVSDNILTNIAGFAHNNDQTSTEELDHLEQNINKDMQRSESLDDPEYFAEFTTEYKKHIGTKQIFIAYGAGNNLDLWSGPHRVVLTAADLSMKGSRKITLTFKPTATPLNLHERQGAYNETVNLNLAGLTIRTTGISKNIKIKDIEDKNKGYAYNPLDYYKSSSDFAGLSELASDASDEFFYRFEKAGFDVEGKKIVEFDLHSIVVDTLRSYIQKAVNNQNVIVLLPNINLVCRGLIREVGLVTKEQPKLTSFTEFPSPLAPKEAFIKQVLSRLGIGWSEEPQDVQKDSAIATGLLSTYRDYEQDTSFFGRIGSKYKNTNFYATLDKATNKGLPNHAETVKSVIDKIQAASKESYQLEYTIFTETDTKVLDYWGTDLLNSYPTFGGYSTLGKSKETIIVGDQALIRDYLYGQVTLDNRKELVEYHKWNAIASKNQENKYNKEADDLEYSAALDKMHSNTGTSYSYPDPKPAKEAKESAGKYKQKYEKHVLDAMVTIPLHPLDSILTNEGYQREIRGIVSPKTKRGSAGFGSIMDIPDDFSVEAQSTDDLKIASHLETYARNKGVSIFKYNTTNPNILDMKFKFAPIYLAQLKFGFAKHVERKASLVTEGILAPGQESLPIRSMKSFVAKQRLVNYKMNLGDNTRQAEIRKIAAAISLDLEKKINSGADEAAQATVAALIKELGEEGNKTVIEIDQYLDGNPADIMTDFSQEMFRKAFMINISTLPSFHLSNIWDINSPCLVFAQDANISQTSMPERTQMNSFFSGQYRILGFTHKISTSKSESSFELTKNLVGYGEGTDE